MVKSRLLTRIFAALGLLWMVIVVVAYYVGHKPVDSGLMVALFWSGARILVAGLVVAVGGGLGRRLFPGIPGRPAVRLAMQVALGLGLLSLAWLVVGTMIGLSRWSAWFVLLISAVWLWRDLLAWTRQWCDLTTLVQMGNRLERYLAFGTFFVFLFTLLVALAPPLKFDALVYHLTLPQTYLAQGKLVYTPWLMFWGMPQVGEMLYTWSAALLDLQTAPVLGWAIGGLATLLILGFGVQKLGVTAGWVAVASLLSGYTFSSALAWGYVDWLGLWYGGCTLVALDAWEESNRPRDLLLAGVMAGFALGTKYTAGVLVLAGVVAIFWHQRKAVREALHAGVVFGLAAGITSSPWWLKNALFTGSPFYPFFFAAVAMDEYRLALYQAQPAWGNWRDVLFLPWQATTLGAEGVPGYSASFGPLLLGLGAAAWVGWHDRPAWARRMLSWAACLVIVGLFVWAIASRLSGLLIQSRLYFSLFPAAALLAGTGFQSIASVKFPGVRLRRLAGILVLLVFGLNVIQLGLTLQKSGAMRWLVGEINSQEYLQKNLGMYALVMQALHELPGEPRVLMLWEPRSLYCRPICDPDEVVDRWATDLHRAGSVVGVLDDWRTAGYTHLLLYNTGVEFYREDPRFSPGDWAALETLVQELPLVADFNQAYQLFSLETLP